jgi:hypothetical protein
VYLETAKRRHLRGAKQSAFINWRDLSFNHHIASFLPMTHLELIEYYLGFVLLKG